MWLEVLSGEDAGRVLEVDRPLVLGRVKGAGLVIRDPRASRSHAELTPSRTGCGCATSTPRTGRSSTASRRTS